MKSRRPSLWALTVPLGALAYLGENKPLARVGVEILAGALGLAVLLGNPRGIREAYHAIKDAVLREWEKRTGKAKPKRKPAPVPQRGPTVNHFGLPEVQLISEPAPPIRLAPEGFPPPEPMTVPALQRGRLGPQRGPLGVRLVQTQLREMEEARQQKLKLG